MSKYKNIRIEVDGKKFASKREAERYIVLRDMQARAEIFNLILQPRFVLQEEFSFQGEKYRPIVYIADFKYHKFFGCHPRLMIEDVKGGKATAVYEIKKKMLFKKLLKEYDNVSFTEIR